MKSEAWIHGRIKMLRYMGQQDMHTADTELMFSKADMKDAKIRELEGVLDTENKGGYEGLYGFGGGGHFKGGPFKPVPVPEEAIDDALRNGK